MPELSRFYGIVIKMYFGRPAGGIEHELSQTATGGVVSLIFVSWN